jgi:sterol desaturase/sphingolipid hydroxylase (fatty acid hydroxylase superfamily)
MARAMESTQSTLGETLLGLFLHAQSRTFWLFLLVAFAIAGIAALTRRGAVLRPDQKLWSRVTWFSRSAVNDYGLILGNALLMATLLGAMVPKIDLNIAILHDALAAIIPPLGDESVWWAPALLAASLFVVDDFLRYVAHYCEHRVPALWELHKVHHSADVMNFMTAERHHPLAMVFYQFITIPGIVIVNALFMTLFGDQISGMGMFGANIFWVATNMLGGALRHSPVWISFGPRVEKWLISPAQHQIHHSDDARHFDCNFGGSLAVWDRMFGTLYLTSPKREDIRFGLGNETADYASFFELYMRPVRGMLALIFAKPVATA